LRYGADLDLGGGPVTNIISPFGIQDLGRREGGSPQFGMTKVSIGSSDTTAIFAGDVVQLMNAAPVTGNFGKYITQASSGLSGNNFSYEGVFRGCEYLNTAVGRQVWSEFWPGAGTGISSLADPIAYIDNDPSKLFIGQCTSAAIITSSMVGMNIQVTATASAGNTTSGQSGIALGSSSVSSSPNSSYPFRILDFYSNYAPSGGFVNGTDNTNAGQIIVVAFNPPGISALSSAGI
jgi:hypothetical protein